MKEIDALVKSAIGYDAARGDQVQVLNMAFARVDATVGTPPPEPLLGLDGSAWFKIIEAAILSVTALLIGLFVLAVIVGGFGFVFWLNNAGGPLNSVAELDPTTAWVMHGDRSTSPSANTVTLRVAPLERRQYAARHQHEPEEQQQGAGAQRAPREHDRYQPHRRTSP